MDLKTLQAGMTWRPQEGWEHDYLHSFYLTLYSERPSRLDERWWGSTVDRFWDWRTIRSRKPPNTQAEILARGLARISHHAVLSADGGREAAFWGELRWASEGDGDKEWAWSGLTAAGRA